MAESLFVRVRRVISASIEDAVDAMERAGGTSVMREAIREVDRAIDEVRAGQEAAAARRLQAMRQQRMFRGQLAALDEKARFAIAENRDDLAEAALSRQIDFEAEAERLDSVQAEAAAEAGRLEECLVALAMRKSQMEEALAAFESAQRDASLGGDGPARPDRRTERRVERAEDAFERAMAGAGGISAASRADAQTAAKVAEIATMQRSAAIAQRMAALRAAREGGA
ncbi:MAG: PspA/IM30 family protein [Acetobacteraceae bacterium]|nr:PspA/IM30 family protein [Acetobacteraceae bacterium]